MPLGDFVAQRGFGDLAIFQRIAHHAEEEDLLPGIGGGVVGAGKFVVADTSDRCIEDLVVINNILDHLKEKGEYQDAFRLPKSRGPPQTSLFG